MRAIDTNVVVRLLTADDPVQAEAARRIVEAGDIFIGVTVLLETEWVLRAGYGFGSEEIASSLCALAGLPGIAVEEPAQIAQALDWMSRGMDFADALHLARSAHCSAFVSFDRKLAKRAKDLALTPVILP
ncbi:MAG: type II toxin-antitoxin system VapC family toxin [Pseudomonadota bacterium]|nr:type II toxin-antitoxin system VapC family toxin [Pseudomonadota bacterium]